MAAIGDADRVRARTPEGVNEWIDHCAAARVEDYATRSSAEVNEQIERLDRSWSLDRVIVIALSMVGLASAALAARRREWLLLNGLASASLLRYATNGGGFAVRALRRIGIRTRREIDSERCALKALRGDFDLASSARSPIAQAGNALQAALR